MGWPVSSKKVSKLVILTNLVSVYLTDVADE